MQKYLDIINRFGLRAQMKKLHEEVYELLEAIDNYEDAMMEIDERYTVEEIDIFRDHVVEEMGDVLILLTQFIGRYDIIKPELDKWMDFKLDRTLERIDTGYYEKGDK
jgi:NTP pyrophosphatase (non-canonical NTP hydrolase)